LGYAWSTGQAAQGPLEDLGAGSYSLTVTDDEGCTASDTLVLHEPLPLAVGLAPADYNGYNTSCHLSADGQITAAAQGGVGGYTYAWPGSGQADSLLTGLTAGTYLLLVTDGNGCHLTDSITLLSPPALLAVDTLLTQPLCHGGTNGSVALTFTGGVPPYLYEGAAVGGATLLDTSLGAGTYTYVLTDQNNCPYTGTFALEEQVSAFELVVLPARCHGEASGSITAEAVGFPPYQWAWSDGQTLPAAANLLAGSYALSVTDGNGCLYLLEAQVEEPPLLGANVSGTDALCHGSHNGTLSIVMNGGTPSYSLQVNGSEAGANVSDLPAGQYAILVVDANGCVWDTVAIIGQPQPLALQVDTLVEATCHGYSDGRLTVSAQGGTPPYQYQWGHGATGAALPDLPAAWYALLLQDAQGCLLRDSIAVLQPDLPQPIFLLTEPTCFGDKDGQVAIQGLTLEDYAFSMDSVRFQEVPAFAELLAGDYTVFLRNDDGCTYAYPFTLPSPPERFIEVLRDQTIKLGDSTEIEVRSLFPLMDIDWSGGDSIRCHACPYTYVRPIYTQDYVVQVISDKGCFNEGTVRIVVDRRNPVYAPNAFSPNGDGANDGFTLFGGHAAVRIERLQVFDRWGSQLFLAQGIPLNDTNLGWDGTLRGEPVNAGVYVFEAQVRLVDGSLEGLKGEVTLMR
jgi:gliding motility-associated-like protein